MSLISSHLKNEYASVAESAEAIIHRHPQPDMAAELMQLSQSCMPQDTRDTYGKGGVVSDFEDELAALFDKPAALFLPTGTLAQCAVLKCHSETTGKTAVALHPTSHLLLHEHMAIEALWGMTATSCGAYHRMLTLDDLSQVNPETLAAVVIESPMREIGGVMPSWQTLCDIRRWCDTQNVRLHLDGARLWQTPPFYQRSLADIAALFDSVYVSFYKDLGGIFGAGLLADSPLITHARIWARRAGGNPITLYPEVLAARRGLTTHLPNMARYVTYTADLCKALADAPVALMPEKPQAAMFHVRINMSAETLTRKVIAYARQSGVLVLPLPRSGDAQHCICEVSVGEHALTRPPSFWATHITACLQAT